jgi:chromosome segregation ATPase
MVVASEERDDMEARIARLESDVGHIRSDLADVKTDLRSLRDKVDAKFDAVNGRIDGLTNAVASAKIWALVLYIALAGSLFGTLARGFGWI